LSPFLAQLKIIEIKILKILKNIEIKIYAYGKVINTVKYMILMKYIQNIQSPDFI